ncbi:class I SAM-dependent methyltransferase [Paenibacillus sp. A14]|uniref:class I SAM-dependent methyltransferase n=1 Tax=Paenibacillus sp. A14 TaxID=3119820 RepID=UPI002FE14E4C
MDMSHEYASEILDYYNGGAEKDRLQRGIGQIEFERTKELILRYLPAEKQVIYDIGGGIGVYSRWLAEMGHEVHMFELAPEAAKHAMELQRSHPSFNYNIEVSDARQLDRPDNSADFVLLMGPLYHLTEKSERIEALREAKRVLKENGVMILSAISRFGSALWGLSVYGDKNDFIEDDDFMEMIGRELTDGQHIRSEKYPHFIARAFFHTPAELKCEMEEAGLCHEKTAAVEGPVWIVPAFEEKWAGRESRERLLAICRMVEEQESLLGMSPHLLAVARNR